MKTQVTPRILGAIFLSLLAFMAPNASALVIVDFDSTEYSPNNFQTMNGWTSGTSSVAYSDSVYRNPQGASYDDTLPSAEFYGGAVTTGTAGLTLYRVGSASPADRIQAGSTSEGSTVSMFVFWKQADFVNLSTGNVSLTSSTAIELSLLAGQSGRSADARLVIQQAGSYYVSSILGLRAERQMSPSACRIRRGSTGSTMIRLPTYR